MVGKRRVTKPTLGVVMYTGLPMTVPAGEIVEIPTAPPEDDRTIDVLWNGVAMMMFVSDLEARSQPTDSE